ncbi:MAG: RNA 2',3'-cyclic phosphodiesterase [Holophagaceae bacterium]
MEARGLRLFFALPLPPVARVVLEDWRRELPPLGGWSASEGLHLTLAFLGQRPAEALPGLEALGATVAARHAAFDLDTTALGAFSGGAHTRLLWLGLAPAPALEALAGDLCGALAAAGEAFDPKPFRAHITLARFRQAQRLDAFRNPPPQRFPADRLVLFESRSQGRYTPLRDWNLRRV